MLQITNLKKTYVEPSGDKLPILDIPSYTLGAGEQAALVGQSGGGKTTLLHIIAGILRPTSGEVIVNGINIAGAREVARDRIRAQSIGYVFQTFNLLPAFSAIENVRLGMSFTKSTADPKRAAELLEKVGLGNRLHHKPNALSVGQQQRVAVARALANRPKLLLADEPTANVDASNQQNIIDLIRQACRDDDVALLVVTHATDIADQFERVDRLDDINLAIAQPNS